MILMMMRLTVLWLLPRRSTESRDASFALFIFGVSMPKGERATLGHESCMGGYLQLVVLVYLLAQSSALLFHGSCMTSLL